MTVGSGLGPWNLRLKVANPEQPGSDTRECGNHMGVGGSTCRWLFVELLASGLLKWGGLKG